MDIKRINQNEKMLHINHTVLKIWGIIYVLFSLSYIPDVLSGYRSILYYIFFLSLMWLPWFVSFFKYKKNKNTIFVKRSLWICFWIFYSFVILTAVSSLTFTYFFPMFILATIFTDEKYLLKMTISILFINIVDIVNDFRLDSILASENITNYQIQITTIIASGILAYSVARLLNRINKSQLLDIEEQKEDSENLLQEVIKRSSLISDNIEVLNDESNKLNINSARVSSNIEEILEGTKDASNTVQKQLEMTNSVNEKIISSSEMASNISEGFKQTEERANLGIKNLDDLNEGAVATNASSKTVTKSVEILAQKMKEVNSIVDLINSIADQTKLLSLNASIEAARAGEAGRGFAVVAEEIQGLAVSTSDATSEIQKLLEDLQSETSVANGAVSELEKANNSQYELIKESYDNFEEILENILSFNTDLSKQNELMSAIMNDNAALTESIEYFAGFSKQLLENTENSSQVIAETIEGIRSQSSILKKTMEDVNLLKEKTK